MTEDISRRQFLVDAVAASSLAIVGASLVACAGGHERCAVDPEQVKADFAAGRTVIVDGWILSATEARACSLESILGV